MILTYLPYLLLILVLVYCSYLVIVKKSRNIPSLTGVIVLSLILIYVSNVNSRGSIEKYQNHISGLLHTRSPFSPIFNENTTPRCKGKDNDLIRKYNDEKNPKVPIIRDDVSSNICNYPLKYDGIYTV